MKSYLELAKTHAGQHKKQNRMTIFCITLAVFLVTAIFSMADFEVGHMSNQMLLKHGNWHIMVKDISPEEANQICQEADVKATGWYDTVNYDLSEHFYIQNKEACIMGMDASMAKNIYTTLLVEGKFPKNDKQIILSEDTKKLFGYQLGDEVSIETLQGTFSYEISGFMEQTSKAQAADAVLAVMRMDTFEQFAASNGKTLQPVFYIQFQKSMRIKDTISELKSTHHWTNDQVSENAAVLGMMGMSSNSYIIGLYGVAILLVVMVVLAGVLMIAGSMNSNVAERTQFFGMLRCIGASRKQIKKLVKREALSWCRTAVPIGVVAATFSSWMICAILRFGIGGEWEAMPCGEISFPGLICGTFVGIITVLIAASAPVKRASKVSPISAIADNEIEAKVSHAATNIFTVDVSLGIHHAISKKKNLILMTGSFALSIILFLSFSVMLDWVGHALTCNKPYSPDLTLYYEDYQSDLTHELCEEIQEIPGIKNVCGRMHKQLDITSKKDVSRIDLISYDDLQFGWAEEDLLKGDIAQVRDEDAYVMTVFEKSNPLEVGDSIDYQGKTLTVGAVLKESPFSSTDIPTIICSEKTFTECTGISNYTLIDIQVQRENSDETVDQIKSLLTDDIKVSDRRATKKEANDTYYAFSFMVYGFLALIALITAFHIINSISMSVSSRTKQYGMMRAIGLSNKQLRKMIICESLSYTVAGSLVGIIAGLFINAKIYTWIITNYFGETWKVPMPALLLVLMIVFGAALIAVYSPVKRIINASITDTINAL